MRADIPWHLLLGRLVTHGELSRFSGFVCATAWTLDWGSTRNTMKRRDSDMLVRTR